MLVWLIFQFGVYINANVIEERRIGDCTVVLRANSVIAVICCLLIVSRIQRYAVIPLSTNSGLLGWVPHSDTLHTLIRDYREKKKILLNIEHRIMLRVSLCYGRTLRSKRNEKTSISIHCYNFNS